MNRVFTGWIFVNLTINTEWKKIVEEEVKAFALSKGSVNCDSIEEKLTTIPIEEWEEGLSDIELAIKETIRIYLVGSVYRRNIGSKSSIRNRTKYHFDDTF
jgi:hypothetical protein